MSIRMSANSREVIGAISTITSKQEYLKSTNGALNVSGSFNLSGQAIPASGLTTAVAVQIVDGSGNQISSFGGGTQYNDNDSVPPIATGPTLEWDDSGVWNHVSNTNPLPVQVPGGVITEYEDGDNPSPAFGIAVFGQNSTNVVHPLQLDSSGNLNVNIASGGGSGGTSSSFASAFPATGTAIGATDGTNMQPLKVDGSDNLLTKINVALPAGTNVIGHVITDTGSTTAVTGTVTISGTVTANAGTNLNTSLLALESGGNLATLAGAVTSSVLQENVKQINGVVPLMGNGVTGTGSQRVTIASDNTAFSVNATLSAETTKVIGVVRNADGSGNLLTSTTNALDVNLKTSSITLPVSIAGTVTISGAVTEATLDAALISQEATTSGIKGLTGFGAVTTNAPSYTNLKSDALSLTPGGGLRVDLKDTASNTNNLNVNLAASAATVTVSATNLSTNEAQINGVTPLMGNGVTGTGSQRVTIASDNTAFSVNATLSAETTKVIGTVNQGTSPWVVSLTSTTITGTVTVAGGKTNNNAAPGATNIGALIGIANAAAPTYTEGDQVLSSLDLAGNTRVILNAETTKVIGVTRTADGSGNLLTSTASALDINIKSGSIANTSFGATQATAANLNATVVQGTAAAVTAPWPVYNGELADTTGTFTNATQTTSVTASGLDGYGNILISITGTYGTATAIFEGSDDGGTTWFPVDAAQTSGSVIEGGYTSLTNTTRSWQVNVPGFDAVRVRSTAVASGTVTVRLSPSAALGADAAAVSLGSALPAGTAALGSVNLSPTASGGWKGYALGNTTNAALTTTQTVSGAAGKFGGYMTLINLNAAPTYIQVFDTTGAVTLGTTAPNFVIAIPANSTAALGVGANMELSNGLLIANGIKIAATTTSNGASTVATGVTGTILYF